MFALPTAVKAGKINREVMMTFSPLQSYPYF